ncbi:Arc family DNA-binding protein [Rhodoferax ferrireducens]|uniref:Arc family DNA-binding protein n=1 Tax=Rhodoferax ferrireducens TaxID=192843 RepID=UPI000E0CE079
MKTEPTHSSQIKVRLPSDLKTWLQHQALDSRRTLNSEIVLRLEQSRTQQLQGVAQ